MSQDHDMHELKSTDAETGQQGNQGQQVHAPQYLSYGRLTLVLIGFLVSVLLTTLDQTIVSTALPRIVSAFNGLDNVTWVATAYFLTQGGCILFVGQILTIASNKTVLLLAVALFELGSLICAVSQSMSVLIFGRAVAGCGAAGIQIAVTATIPEIAPLQLRPVLFSLFGAILGISSVAGPLLGGVLTDKVSWRWCFYINLPFGAVTIVLVSLFLRLPASRDSNSRSRKSWLKLDWIGAILGLGFVTCLLLALQWGGKTKPWNSAVVIAMFVVFGIILGLFFAWAWFKGSTAMLPLVILERRTQLGCFFSGFFAYMSLFMGTYYLPLWYQASRGVDATKSGLNILPFLISVVIAAGVSGGIVTKTGRYWWILLLSPLVGTIGSGLLFTIDDSTSLGKLIGYQILFGVGIGTVFQNVIIAVQADYAHDESMIPQATSLVSFAQMLGGVVGLAIAGSVFGNNLGNNLAPVDLPPELKVAVQQSVTVIQSLPPGIRDSVRDIYVKSLDPVFLIGIPAGILTSLAAFLITNYNVKERSVLAEHGKTENQTS